MIDIDDDTLARGKGAEAKQGAKPDVLPVEPVEPAERHARRFRDAMDLIIRACDQALADARLADPAARDGPLQQLVVDLLREKAAARRCRVIFMRYVEAAAAEMHQEAAALDDAYMHQIAAALETDDYQHLAP